MRYEGEIGAAVANNVARLRAERGWTYPDLSRRLDDDGWLIPVLGLRRIESGERKVGVDDLAALCLVFGVAVADLLFDPARPAPELAAKLGLSEAAKDRIRARKAARLRQMAAGLQEVFDNFDEFEGVEGDDGIVITGGRGGIEGVQFELRVPRSMGAELRKIGGPEQDRGQS